MNFIYVLISITVIFLSSIEVLLQIGSKILKMQKLELDQKYKTKN